MLSAQENGSKVKLQSDTALYDFFFFGAQVCGSDNRVLQLCGFDGRVCNELDLDPIDDPLNYTKAYYTHDGSYIASVSRLEDELRLSCAATGERGGGGKGGVGLGGFITHTHTHTHTHTQAPSHSYPVQCAHKHTRAHAHVPAGVWMDVKQSTSQHSLHPTACLIHRGANRPTD